MEDFFVPMGFEPMERETHAGWGCLVLRGSRFACSSYKEILAE